MNNFPQLILIVDSHCHCLVCEWLIGGYLPKLIVLIVFISINLLKHKPSIAHRKLILIGDFLSPCRFDSLLAIY